MIELAPSAGTEEESAVPRWFQRRTKFERKLLVALGFVGAIFIGFLIDACTTTSNEDSNICLTSSCIKIAAEIIKQVDRNVKPCDDFFKFSCGKIKDRTHHKNTPQSMLHNKVKKQVQNILEEPVRDGDHQALKDEKILFQACMNEQKNGVSLETIKSIFNDLNGMPVLMGAAWNDAYFDWSETMIKLKRMGLGYYMLFRTFLSDDSDDGSSRIIDIRPTVAFSAEEPHLYLFENYLKESTVIYGANESDANHEMEEVFQFVLQLDQIGRSDGKSRKFSLSEFQGRYPEVNWVTYFESIRSINVTMDDNVTVPFNDYMDKFLELMRNTSKRTIANYMLWSAVGETRPFISKSFIDMNNQISCVKGFDITQDVEQCDNALRKIFSPRPSAVNYARKYIDYETRNGVTRIFSNVFLEFKRVLKQSSWLDEESSKNVSKWFNDIQLIIGAPESEMDKVFRNYKPITNMHEPFLKIFLENRMGNRKLLEQEDDETNKYQIMYHFVPQTHIVYMRTEHFIMIPSGFLQGMYFHDDWPMYLNYGGLGKVIGVALTQTASLKMNLNSSDPWASQLNSGFQHLISCLKNSSETPMDTSMSNRNYLEKMKMTEINGIKLAYQAYKKWLEDDEENSLMGLEYTPEQLFWIWTFAQSCYDETDDQSVNFYADNEVVRHNVHFAADFKCEPNSKMNPEKKCDIS